MTRNPRYDILFDAVPLGPVTAPNRFYQSPQCNGMGRNYPGPLIEMRGVKAEGGWGVVFNEQCDFHYSTDNPRNVRLWDEQDLPLHEAVVAGMEDSGLFNAGIYEGSIPFTLFLDRQMRIVVGEAGVPAGGIWDMAEIIEPLLAE